jgi:hypothetical protein
VGGASKSKKREQRRAKYEGKMKTRKMQKDRKSERYQERRKGFAHWLTLSACSEEDVAGVDVAGFAHCAPVSQCSEEDGASVVVTGQTVQHPQVLKESQCKK